jgi:hypothetical protein
VSFAQAIERPTTCWKGLGFDILGAAGVEDLVEQGIAIPYRLPDGRLAYTKRIAVDGRSWYEPSPISVGGLIPFGLESVSWARLRGDDILLVCEGESDALCARERIAEWDGRRVLTLGMPGATSWRSSWAKYVRPFAAVFVIPDADVAGRRMAGKVRVDCPWVRVVDLPDGDDLRSFVQREGAQALLPLLDEATHLLKVSIGFRICRTLDELEEFLREPMP